MKESKGINRIIFACIGLSACLFFMISLLSFSITDWPNPDVASEGNISNLCGPAGAYLAYYSNYYLGPAVIPMLTGLGIYLVLICMRKPMEQLVLRSIGIVLFAAAVAASSYLFEPGGSHGLTIGNGGILGVGLGHFLLTKTALTGASLILAASMIVGLLLAADNILMILPRLVIQIADRLRRAGPVLAGIGIGIKQDTTDSKQKQARKIFAKPKRQIAALNEVILPEEQPKQEPAEYIEDEDEADEEFECDETKDDAEESIDQQELEPEAEKSLTSIVPSALAKMLGQRNQNTSEAGPPHREDYRNYSYPPVELLAEPEKGFSALQEKVIKQRSQVLERTLQEFNINAKVVDAETGPVITMFELELSPGIKVSQVTNLSNDMARSLGAGSVRVVAPIPGKHTIGLEVPNHEKEKVRVKELLNLSGQKPSKMHIPLFLGKDAHGDPLICDLATMPHCLIAGTTGSGKSVCINSIIISILLTQRPDMVKLILVDPKMVEMNAFRDLAHLMCPIVTEMKRAEQILQWLTEKMDERYALLAEARVRNIADYNKLSEEEIYERFNPTNEEEKAKILLRMPYMVIIIDELADLMMTSAKEVEAHIIRLAQKSRAIGIHIVLATQRPQATVVTGLIKSNLPCRISFRVAARMDSRIVLDQNGAETLLGQGDMLFLKPGTSDLTRAQGTFISDDEINRIVKYLKENAQPNFHPELVQINHLDTQGDMERDELFDEAVNIILKSRRGSVSLLQRRLTIGYSRASRLIDQMAMAGIVGEYKGSQAREVLLTPEDYEAIKRQMQHDAIQGYSDLQEEETESVSAESQANPVAESNADSEIPDESGDNAEESEDQEEYEDYIDDPDSAEAEDENDEGDEGDEEYEYVYEEENEDDQSDEKME